MCYFSLPFKQKNFTKKNRNYLYYSKVLKKAAIVATKTNNFRMVGEK